MLFNKYIPRPKATLLRVLCGCALAWGTGWADDTTLASQGDSSNRLLTPGTSAQLRSPDSPEAASAASPSLAPAADTNAAPASVQPPVAPPGPGPDALVSGLPSIAMSATPPRAAGASDPGPASDPASPAAASDGPPNAWKDSYVNLINLLVDRGVLTKKDSGHLISQAEEDAKKTNSAHAQAAAVLASPASPPNPDDDTMRVAYMPETVKEQLRDEIKDDVMAQARDEHWAAPDSTPEWVKRYRVTADLRNRYDGQSYPSGNSDTVGNGFPNFNSINTGSPYDVTKGVAPPLYNVDQDRNRFRLRARIGAEVDVGDGFTAGMRIATGNDDSPVTENQTFGGANNAQGGNFGKYAIWLDRAFLKYQLGGTPGKDFTATIGRFDNPFFSTSMIWADDLGFDGLAAKGKYQVAEGVKPFLTGGAFPVFNTDLNFASNNAAKFRSEDKWLFAGQAGTDWQISHDFSFKGAVAYYDFENIEGKVSSPMDSTDPAGNTDDSRPSFAQNGNTYIALRNITSTGGVSPATSQPQYFGLATQFHEVAFTAQLDYTGFEPFDISLIGEFVKNLAFDRTAIENNGAPSYLGGVGPQNNLSNGTFAGGDTGYDIRLNVGHPSLQKLLDWNMSLTYRYIESDAVVDGFTDSDFGGSLAGTNLQGYIIGGNLALTPRVWVGFKWMSANAIVGPTFRNDLLQLDLNAKF